MVFVCDVVVIWLVGLFEWWVLKYCLCDMWWWCGCSVCGFVCVCFGGGGCVGLGVV